VSARCRVRVAVNGSLSALAHAALTMASPLTSAALVGAYLRYDDDTGGVHVGAIVWCVAAIVVGPFAVALFVTSTLCPVRYCPCSSCLLPSSVTAAHPRRRSLSVFRQRSWKMPDFITSRRLLRQFTCDVLLYIVQVAAVTLLV
jgi:hypothetical protein